MELTDQIFRTLVESVEDYAIFLLDPDGVVQSWNAGARRIKGYEAPEIVGRHFSAFYTPEDRTSRRWLHGLTAARTQGRFEDVGWRVHKDGSQFWASVVITALRGEGGALIGFAKVTRDLTDRAYRAFVEAASSIVWMTDAAGHSSADSPSWRAFTGQPEAEWRGPRAWDPVHPDDQPALRAAWAHAREQAQPFAVELRLRRHDGAYVWMTCRAIPFLNPEGAVREWFGVIADISARKAAEQERERAMSWWETTLRSIGDGVIATDARGSVNFLNSAAEALTGWTTAEARGKGLAEVFRILDEETGAPTENPVDKVLREGRVVGLANHTVLVRRDGATLAIDDSAAPIRRPDGALEGVVLVFHDASAEKQEANRRALLMHVSEELVGAADYRQALSHLATFVVPRMADWCAVHVVEPDAPEIRSLAIAHADPAKVAYARGLAERAPLDPGAALGVPQVIRTGRPELYRELSPELLDRLDRLAAGGELRRIIGEEDLRSAVIVPLRGAHGTLGTLTFVYTGQRRYAEADLAFAEDLARRAALLIERRRLEEEALSASKVKDEFLAMLGHELRNPLAPIRTALHLMERRASPETAKERQIIERQVDHLVRLVDDLLDVSRIMRGQIKLHREPLELGAVLAHALEMASPLLDQRRQHLHLDVPREGLSVDGDPARLAQVFSNLLVNAAKFTDVGGHITVTAAPAGREVTIAVEDTGIGLAPELLSSLFEPFVQARQTAERASGGLGLGLTIVRSLVTMHGGTVSAHSEGTGRGSTFTVRLPALERASAPGGAAPPAQRARAAQRFRILLVDDNADAAEMLAELLDGSGYDVRITFDGPSALELVRDFVPDVAILDIGLPVMDGYELAAELRALLGEKTPRLVALSGYGHGEAQRRAAAAGFERYLVKPLAFDTLSHMLEELTRRA